MENACIDAPSILDYEYEPLFGSETALPVEFVCRVPRIQDQSSDVDTGMGCTRFGLAHPVNTQNKRVADETRTVYKEILAKDYWIAWINKYPSARTDGASLQSALDQFKKAGEITGYSKCFNIAEMKSAIYRYRFIYTGSQVGDWNSVGREHIYRVRTDGRIVGHAFCIVGWDASGWVAVNSYGENNGYFTIPFDLTDTLFSRYAVSDTKDEEAISLYKKSIMDNISIEEAKKAFEAKIWNGERSKDPVTREECAAMIFRSMSK